MMKQWVKPVAEEFKNERQAHNRVHAEAEKNIKNAV
jgi:hypothetical protein